MDNIKNKIKELRISKNLTQQQLADELHVTKQAISKWEKGKSVPDIASVESMSEFFGVSVDYLINDNIEAAKSDTATGTQFKYFNKLNIVLISVIALMLAAIVALSVAMGVLVNKFNEFETNTSDAPDIVEVNGFRVTYLSDETRNIQYTDVIFDVWFNVYNLSDVTKTFDANNFTVNYPMYTFPATSYLKIEPQQEQRILIEIHSSSGHFGDASNRFITIKYVGYVIAKIDVEEHRF